MKKTWTDERIATLKNLWLSGLSAGQIAAKMGLTKNAVLGKVHRLDFPRRGNPVQFTNARTSRVKRNPSESISGLRSTSHLIDVPVSNRLEAFSTKAVLPIRKHDAVVYTPVKGCQFPHGEPGARSFRFCDKAPKPGKVYCSEHASICYIRPSIAAE